MGSQENSNWFFDCSLIDEINQVPDPIFTPIPNPAFNWPLNSPPNLIGLETDGTFGDSEGPKENSSKKRGRSETCGPSSSKACREKLRRDRLNDKFTELSSVLEPGRSPMTDKTAILMDAVRMVTQLRTESQKLKDTNLSLQEKIKELKTEKNELRNEKQRLKGEKEKLEQQLTSVNSQPGFLPIAPTHAGKLMPFMGYPGMPMWQFMPPAAVDTSQDHTLRPPVA